MATKAKSANEKRRIAPSACPMTIYIQKLHEKGQPIRLQLNGQKDLEIDDEGSYQKLLELVERIETVKGLREALADVDSGRTLSLEQMKERVRRHHGISH